MSKYKRAIRLRLGDLVRWTDAYGEHIDSVRTLEWKPGGRVEVGTLWGRGFERNQEDVVEVLAP